jgi:hypothetical protein
MLDDMSKKNKQTKAKLKDLENKIVDFEKLKALGITRNPDDIEEIDGENISGGKDDADTVDTHWPTGMGQGN